jgi:hypothetical protein
MIPSRYPMSWDFEAALKRVMRAEAQRVALDQAIQRFARAEPPAIPLDQMKRLQAKGRQPPPYLTRPSWSLVRESKPNLEVGDEVTVRLALNSPPDTIEWGIVLGELVHNLSAALDNVAWIATVAYQDRKYHASPPPRPLPPKWRNIAFPIVATPAEWPKEKAQRLWGVSPEAEEYFELDQPYNTGEPTLCILRELSNIDKHQWINLLATNVNVREVGLPPGLTFTPKTMPELETYAEVGRIRLLTEEGVQRYLAGEDLKFQLTWKVVFAKGTPAEGQLISDVLDAMITSVRFIVMSIRVRAWTG